MFTQPSVRGTRHQLFLLIVLILLAATTLFSSQRLPLLHVDTVSANAVAAFQLVDNFESSTLGRLNGQNGWQAAGDVQVARDPQSGSNQVLQFVADGTDQDAYKALTSALPNNSSGTLHFRLRRDGHLDGFGGLSHADAPGDWSDYETQFGGQTNQAADRFVARNGGSFDALATGFDNGTWYCVWLLVDNSADRYSAYVQGGSYTDPTQIGTDLSFRNGTTEALRTFYARIDDRSQSDLFFDDIYIDPSAQSLTSPLSSCGAAPPTATPTVTPTPTFTPTPLTPAPTSPTSTFTPTATATPTPTFTPTFTPTPTTGAGGFQVIDDFNGLTVGSLQGQSGWQASDNARVSIDPHNSTNQVLQVRRGNRDYEAYKPLTAPIAEGSTGTLYFRLRREGALDGFAGASAEQAPSDWTEFETQFGGQTASNNDQFVARNGGSFAPLAAGFAERTWYCVWLVVDNSRDRYKTYVQGGIYTNPTQLGDELALRNGGNSALRTFYTRLDDRTVSDLWLDDLYVDPTTQNLSAPGRGCNTVNQPPRANDDSYQTPKDTALAGASILGNDSDPDGDPITLNTSPIQETTNGALTLNADGTFSYVPQSGFVGQDAFRYRICDSGSPALCDEAQVSIAVVEQNAPPAANDDYYTVEKNSQNQRFGVLDNDTTESGETLTISTVTAPNRGGTVTIAGGQLSYTPATEFTGEEQFSYTVDDGNGGTDSATVIVDVIETVALNLTVRDLEVSQTIQTLGNSVPLVARRPAFARLYVGVENVSEPVRGVTARLHGSRNGVALPGSPLQPINPDARMIAYQSPNRERLEQTLNFNLPLSWLNAGALTLRAEVNPERTIQETNYNDNESSDRTLTLQTIAPMEMVLIPIAYQRNGQGPIYRPSLNESNNMGLGMLQKIYPISEVSYRLHAEYYFDGDLGTHEGWLELLQELAQLRLQERPGEPVHSIGANVFPKYYGVLPREGAYWGGIAYRPGTVGMGLVYQEDVAAHEVGHNLGLRHVESSVCGAQPSSPDPNYPYANSAIGNVGIDLVEEITLSASTRELMSYCWPKWISDYHYNKMFDVLRSAQSSAARVAAAGPLEDRLLISGRITPDNEDGTLDHALPVQAPAPLDTVESGPFILRLVDSTGAVQQELSFTPATIVVEGDESAPSDFGFTLPRIADLAKVQLWHQSTLLATLQAGAAPDLQATFTEDAEDPNKITISWDLLATATATANAYVNLRYSPDGGTSWQILALQLEGNSYTLDTSKIPGSGDGLIEIVANSTTDAATVQLNIGQIRNKVPAVAILDNNQTTFAVGETIVLFGAAVDFEDGSITEENLTWLSAGNEILGMGSQLIIPQGLPAGTHTIYLRAMDSNDNFAIASIEITVGNIQETFLPLIQK